jgi:hypothetical protein
MRAMDGANSEECSSPPPAKKARANNAPPAKATVMQYGRWAKPPSSTLPAQVQPSMQATLNRASVIQYARRPKPPSSTLPAQVQPSVPAPVPATQVTAPAQDHEVTLQHTLPGPLIAAPSTLGQDATLQHALPGPSGTQAQTDYANVSIFFLPIYFFQCFSPFQSQYKLISARH